MLRLMYKSYQINVREKIYEWRDMAYYATS